VKYKYLLIVKNYSIFFEVQGRRLVILWRWLSFEVNS